MNLKTNLEPFIGLFALALIVCGLGFLIVREPQRIVVAQQQLLAVQLDEAMTIYAENCAVCHGAGGEGIGSSPSLNTETVRQMSYEGLFKVIARGLYNTAMPAWSETEGGALSDYQITELVALIQVGDWDVTKARVEALGLTPKVPFAVQPDAEVLAQLANLADGETLIQAVSLYAENCIACHGSDGKGTAIAPALASAAVMQKDPQELSRSIALGIPGTLMAGWQNKLENREIEALVTLIKEWEQIPAGIYPEPQIQLDLSPANLSVGEQLYATNCARCHGVDGYGTPRGPALNVKSFLTQTSDSAIQQIIRAGIAGTAMIAWGDRLTEHEILSLVAYLRNWEATAPEIATPLQKGGGGPPWLRSAGIESTSQTTTGKQDGAYQNPAPYDRSPGRESLLSDLLRNWRTILLAVGVLTLAFWFILSALNGAAGPRS